MLARFSGASEPYLSADDYRPASAGLFFSFFLLFALTSCDFDWVPFSETVQKFSGGGGGGGGFFSIHTGGFTWGLCRNAIPSPKMTTTSPSSSTESRRKDKKEEEKKRGEPQNETEKWGGGRGMECRTVGQQVEIGEVYAQVSDRGSSKKTRTFLRDLIDFYRARSRFISLAGLYLNSLTQYSTEVYLIELDGRNGYS